MTTKASEKAWWKEAVVYQIYPASFLDSDDDGLCDIPGILSKMDYIQSLDVTAVWLSPISKSLNTTWDMTSPTTARSTNPTEQSSMWRN
jgi:glycosidase